MKLSERTMGAEKYRFGFQGQEMDNEVKGQGKSVNYTFRMHDPRLGRFFAIDPLTSSYPFYSTYQFSGNCVINSKELEGLEPSTMIKKNGYLTKPMITVLNAAFGYSISSLKATKWESYTNHPAWASLVGLPEKCAASVKNEIVVHDDYQERSDIDWFGLIAHEQSHRVDIDENPWFYEDYILHGAFVTYRDIPTEKRAYKFGSNSFSSNDYSDQLLRYKNGLVLSTLSDNGLSNSQKNKILTSVGNQFRRDVIIADAIKLLENEADKLRKDIKDLSGSTFKEIINWWVLTEDRANLKQIQFEIKERKKEQEKITKKYGN